MTVKPPVASSRLPGAPMSAATRLTSHLRAHQERIEMSRASRRTPEQSSRRAKLPDAPYPIGVGEIGMLSLLLMAEKDSLIPNAATQAVAGFLREPRVPVISGVEHIAAIEAPDELARWVISFLMP